MTLWKSIPGSGDIRLYTDHYLKNGTRIRLAARGNTTAAILYDYVEGTDTQFQATNGTGLGGAVHPYFQGLTLKDRFYFTDRFGALRKYEMGASTQVLSVTQPAAPVVMPGAKARPYRFLDSWNGNNGTATFGWTESSSGNYDIADATSSHPSQSPGSQFGVGIGSRTVGLTIAAGGTVGMTISEDVTGEAINSHTIAYWLKQTRNRFHQAFEIGLLGPGEFSVNHRNPEANEWYPVFLDVGNIPSIGYKRFRIFNDTDSTDYIGPLILPGKLFGSYRWIYTHYNPTTGGESEPSPVSNSGSVMDFSVVGQTGVPGSSAAFNKACALTFTTDAGTDAATTKVRFYRNGGVPELTKDSNGRDVWFRVGEVFDLTVDLSTSPAAGAVTFTLSSTTNFAVGDTIVLEKGTASKEEYCEISVIGGAGAITVREPLLYSHSAAANRVQMAFLDNVANEEINLNNLVQLERDDPPTAVRWIALSPDGRLWLFNYTDHPTGVAVSNKPTFERPNDFEVFPLGVDPLTRRDLIQGWRFDIGGDTTDEEIMWGGFFQGMAHVLTRTHLYRISAYSQADWGPTSVQKVANVGLMAGETVQEIQGALYWVAPGPLVMRWDGQSLPEAISQRDGKPLVNVRLAAGPTGSWPLWFARYHQQREGHLYLLYYVPTGQTTATHRLSFNISSGGAWEEDRRYNAASALHGWRGASVRNESTDVHELYVVNTLGAIYQQEVGTTDDGQPIRLVATTKRLNLNGLALIKNVFVRLEAVTDEVVLTVTAGGSEYGENSYEVTLDTSGADDLELKIPIIRTVKGRWISLEFTGSTINSPAIREIVVESVMVRTGRVSV